MLSETVQDRCSLCRPIEWMACPNIERRAELIEGSQQRAVIDSYSNAINPGGVARLIEAAASNAWLIFYTHDIDERPRKYGCTLGYLKQLSK